MLHYHLLNSFMHITKRDFRLEILKMLAIANAQLHTIPRTFKLILNYIDFRWIKVKWCACFYISQRGGQTWALPRHGVRPTRHVRPQSNPCKQQNSNSSTETNTHSGGNSFSSSMFPRNPNRVLICSDVVLGETFVTWMTWVLEFIFANAK